MRSTLTKYSSFINKPPTDTNLITNLSKNSIFNRVLDRYAAKNGEEYSTNSITVKSPVTRENLAILKQTSTKELDQTLAKSSEAFADWKNLTAKARSGIISNYASLIKSNYLELAEILSAENGKPLNEAVAETLGGVNYADWFAGEAKRAYGQTIPSVLENNVAMTFKQPVGPTSMITPWNFPSSMVTRKAIPALAAGCTVTLKPAVETPLTAFALKLVAEDAGIPADAFNIVIADYERTPEFGEKMFTDPRVSAVSFTGSTKVGKILQNHASSSVKKSCMELGGNAPFMVMKTGDLEKAVDGIMMAKFRNNGQVCIAPNRVLVHHEVHDQFVSLLSERMKSVLKFGPPEDKETTLGPMIYSRAVDQMESFVDDAVCKGANVVMGGNRAVEAGELFFEPTLLVDCTEDMLCVEEEIFGPIVSVVKFEDEIDCLEKANKGLHGLAAYLYSNDASQIWRMAKVIETGMLGVNQAAISHAEYPFGGVRESGLGREGGSYGLEAYLETKYLHWGHSN